MPVMTFDALEDVPDGLREFAKDHGDGKITVNVVPEVKLSEFRDNNINVSKERDTLRENVDRLKSIVGEDPDGFEKELAELRVTRDRVAAGDLRESRALEEAIGKRTEEMRKKFEEELQARGRDLNAWKDKYGGLDRRYRDEKVIQAVKDAATHPDSGVQHKAIQAVAEQALKVFRVMDDGRIIAMNGDVPVYGTNGVDPMTPSEWLQKLKESEPFYFMGTQGGGAGGDTSKKGGHGMSFADLKTLTPQEKLALANKESRPFQK